MSAYTTNRIGVIGIVLGVCVVIVAVFAYGQISILQRSASDLETDKNYLQNQVATLNADKASLENQVATLNADKANLESQVTVLQCEVYGFHYVMIKDMPHERPRIDFIPE